MEGNSSMKIKKIEKVHYDEPKPVYDLTVDSKYHNFFISTPHSFIPAHNCDEINERGVETAINFLNSIDNRFSSRFQGSPFVFQAVVSSARTTNSPIGEYIKHLPKNDPSIEILSPCLWEVKPDPNFIGDGTTFPVLVGNGSIPSSIITDEVTLKAIDEGRYVEPTGCSLIHVPTVYRSKFELQLDQSIQDIAGMTTSDNNMVFRDTSRLEDTALLPELYMEANIRDNINLLDLLPVDRIFEKGLNNRWYFKRAPNAPRFCHVDLGGSGERNCDTALCIGHKEWKNNTVTNMRDTIYVVDMLIFVTAPIKVDLKAIENFLIGLVKVYNAPIHTVSFDQWQSLVMTQNLEVSGCFTEVKKVSVDLKPEPYMNAARLMELGQVKIGACPKLKKELEALIFEKGRVTRTTELKDGADVLTGFIYDAQMCTEATPIDRYKNAGAVKFDKGYKLYINKDEYLTDLF